MGDCRKLAKGDDKLATISDDQGNCDLIVLPANGDPFWTIPFSNAAVVAPGAASLPVGTVPAGLAKLLIRKGSYIGAKAPGSDYYVPIQLASDFSYVTGTPAPAMSIESLAEQVAIGSTFAYPVPIGNTSSINPSRARQSVQGAASDPNGFQASAPGTATSTVAITCDSDDTDPGQLNMNRYQELGETCIVAVHFPKYRNTIRKKTLRGIGYFSDHADTLANNAAPTTTTTFNYDRKPETKAALAA